MFFVLSVSVLFTFQLVDIWTQRWVYASVYMLYVISEIERSHIAIPMFINTSKALCMQRYFPTSEYLFVSENPLHLWFVCSIQLDRHFPLYQEIIVSVRKYDAAFTCNHTFIHRLCGSSFVTFAIWIAIYPRISLCILRFFRGHTRPSLNFYSYLYVFLYPHASISIRIQSRR